MRNAQCSIEAGLRATARRGYTPLGRSSVQRPSCLFRSRSEGRTRRGQSPGASQTARRAPPQGGCRVRTAPRARATSSGKMLDRRIELHPASTDTASGTRGHQATKSRGDHACRIGCSSDGSIGFRAVPMKYSPRPLPNGQSRCSSTSNFASLVSLGLRRIAGGAADKNVGHGVPGVVDADEQQAERCSSDDE